VCIIIVYYNNNISFRILRFACVCAKSARLFGTENKWPGRGGCVRGKKETRHECNVAFCPRPFAISLQPPPPPPPLLGPSLVYTLVRIMYTYTYNNMQYYIVLLLQSVLLFPSGDARKSLFYGKQHCLETLGDTKYSRFVLFVECLAALKNVVWWRQWRAKCTAVDEPLRAGGRAQYRPRWRTRSGIIYYYYGLLRVARGKQVLRPSNIILRVTCAVLRLFNG